MNWVANMLRQETKLMFMQPVLKDWALLSIIEHYRAFSY